MSNDQKRVRLTTSPCAILMAMFLVANVAAQAPLPVVENVEPALLHEHSRALQQVLDGSSLLSKDEKMELSGLLQASVSPESAAGIQKLLDRHCLVGVNINPESRVKAARGPAAADLSLDREALVLIKVHNEAGVSDALKVTGEQLIAGRRDDSRRWLELAVLSDKPLRKTLSGQKVEYVVVRLKPREPGKREATLKFDVGQGTQDLGFRAEVPVLFTISK